MNEEMIELNGTVENIIYTNNSNGYTVCEIDTGDAEPITLVGILPYLAVGEIIKALGTWQTHPSYGKQFKAEYYEKQLPIRSAAILKYLSSRSVKGIGPQTAKKIVGRFGDETFDVIENHPEWLSDISGITPKKAREISDNFKSQFGIRTVMMFCRDFFGPETIMKIYKRWGSGAVEVIKNNPYILCDEIYGVGFVKADSFASSLGVDKSSINRAKSGMYYALSYNAIQNGHTFIPSARLIKLASSMLEINDELAEEAMNVLESEGRIINTELYGRECTYLKEYYDAEKYIVKKLRLLDRTFERIPVDEIEMMINQIQSEEGIIYAGLQRKAVYEALENGVMILTGGPGTGKTTIIRAVIAILSRLGYKVALTAPTGRAAKRMSEATQNEAKTIHRLLESEFVGGDVGNSFKRNENNLLEENIVIIDETSMVDTMLMSALLKAIKPGARLIIIGDADQLPSVGAGNVLNDLIASEYFATVRLTEIFRQACESRIVTNAHAINNGELPVLTDKKGDFFFLQRDSEEKIIPTIIDLYTNRLLRTYGEKAASGIQVITPSHKGVAGTDILNSELQKAMNPFDKSKREHKYRDRIYREGDKVMQIKNNYELEWVRPGEEGSGIFNGDIGRIISISPSAETMKIAFDDRICDYPFENLEELDHAYAITIHKSQGSEYPIVIMPIYRYSPKLLTRNLFYTAVTRAQNMVILVGSAAVIQSMVENNKITQRYTGLKTMIEKE